MADTITELTADQLTRLAYAKRMRWGTSVDLDPDQLYAVTLIKLNNAVTPADYATIGAAIAGVTGVQSIQLLADHHTRATLPADTHLVGRVGFDLDIADDSTPV